MVEEVRRRLAAILAADVVGYSRLMEADEPGTLAALTAHREELIELKTPEPCPTPAALRKAPLPPRRGRCPTTLNKSGRLGGVGMARRLLYM